MSYVPQTEANLTCDECGRFGAIDFGERKLCLDCYECSGSCCPEFGKARPEQGALIKTLPESS